MKKAYTISSDGIDSYIWDVQRVTMKSLSIDDSYRALSPLRCYISTGRASCDFLRKLFQTSPARIARILTSGGSDAEIIKRIHALIKYTPTI